MKPDGRPEFLAWYCVESPEHQPRRRLGTLLQQVAQAVRPARILVSGGDTSSSIARALDIRVVEVAARLAPGAPLCRVLESRSVAGAEVAFKGGQMGSRNFFDEARHGAGT